MKNYFLHHKYVLSLAFAISLFFVHGFAQESLVVSTIERPPFVMIEDGEISWFSIELWEEVAKRWDIEYMFEVETVFSDMLDKVSAKESDLAVANISITSQREETMDFSQPTYDSWLHMLVKDTWATWFLLNDILCWWQCLSLVGCIIFLLLSLIIVRKRVTAPLLSRILHIAILSALFVSIFVLNMVYQQEKNKHNTIDIAAYLSTHSVWAAAWTTMSAFLDELGISYTSYEDFDDSLAALESGEVEVILWDAAISSYYVAHEWQGKVDIHWPLFAPDKLAIAFVEDSPYAEEIDILLLEIKEDGTYGQLLDKYFWR